MTAELNNELQKQTLLGTRNLEVNSSWEQKEKNNEEDWIKPMGLTGHNQKKQYVHYGNSRRRR